VVAGVWPLTDSLNTAQAIEAVLVGSTDRRLVTLTFSATALISRTRRPLAAPTVITIALHTDPFANAIAVLLADFRLLTVEKLGGTGLNPCASTRIGVVGSCVDLGGTAV